MTDVVDSEVCTVTFRVLAQESATNVSLTGSTKELGFWHLHSSIRLHMEGAAAGDINVWESKPLSLPISRFPFTYRCFANGHRSSPTSRPMVWDVEERVCPCFPSDGIIECEFMPNEYTSQSGWVTHAGAGGFQLRVSPPKNKQDGYVSLFLHQQEPWEIVLRESVPGDPAIPSGKDFAVVKEEKSHAGSAEEPTFIFNGPSFESLAFRVDIVSKEAKRLLARGLISHHSFQSLEGALSCCLMGPDLELWGWFQASYLVVVPHEHPHNCLSPLYRKRWMDGENSQFFYIGHRGSGASKKDGSSVRENTVLAFQKAATNMADFVEFDVHVTKDGEVVVHHDFTVKLNLGNEILPIGVPALTTHQLQSRDVTMHMVTSSYHRELLNSHDRRCRSTFKRTPSEVPFTNLSEAGNMNYSNFEAEKSPSNDFDMIFESAETGSTVQHSTPDSTSSIVNVSSGETNSNLVEKKPENIFRIADKMATLREAFRNTPSWLGFNIELKYPTDAEMAALATRFYSRNYFVDSILKEVFDEAGNRPIIFSSFDPDCATLLSLKQPKYPVYFLTCAGTETYTDSRMNTLQAALNFASSSNLQGVVAEASALLDSPTATVAEFHSRGLALFSWGDLNNNIEQYLLQKDAGVDGIILDNVTRMAKATMKKTLISGI